MKPELRELCGLIGPGALRSLQTSGRLHIWRRSSPHNWWVESKRGEQLWHSADRPRLLPDIRLFDKVEDSEYAIITGSWLAGSDEGRPESSTYRLKRKYRL